MNITGPELPPLNGKQPEYLCIIFHGYGADGYNLFDLAKPLSQKFPNMQFLVPNGTYECEVSADGRQWFSLLDRTDNFLYDQLQKESSLLHKYIFQQLERFNLKEDRLILMGFSQGAMLSLHLALSMNKNILSVGAFSGKLCGDSKLIQIEKDLNTPIFLIHGEDDMVVPFSEFEKTIDKFNKLGINFKSKSIKYLGHSIDYEGLEFFMNNLSKIIKE